jgi:hypothetical protein
MGIKEAIKLLCYLHNIGFVALIAYEVSCRIRSSRPFYIKIDSPQKTGSPASLRIQQFNCKFNKQAFYKSLRILFCNSLWEILG